MDTPTVITPTNLLLWILLALLLIWLATFAYLALRRDTKPTTLGKSKAILTRSVLTTSAQQQLQKLATKPTQATVRSSLAAQHSREDAVLERSLS